MSLKWYEFVSRFDTNLYYTNSHNTNSYHDLIRIRMIQIHTIRIRIMFWYEFVSYKFTQYEFVSICVWRTKLKKTSVQKRDPSLSPGMRESVHLLPKHFRHHPNYGVVPFHYVPEKSNHHPEKEMVQIPRLCI